MSLADQQWCPTSVQVTVLQARGLRIKGKSGTNDAYAVMQVAKEKYQTSVVEKSVAPVWKEEAAFDLHQGGGGERSTLHVHVLHRALVGPDKLLGQAVINLLQLSEDKTRNKTEWFKLLDKTGKSDKDRGEVLVDIQFMRNNMTASMFDISAAGKSRSRLGKFKDKVRGKKKESDAASSMVPSFTQVLTDSEDEANGEAEVAAGKDEKKKKLKMKSLFSPKSNLQKNMSQSMSVLPGKNSSLSGSLSSGLNVDSSEGKKKFKFMIHKRSGSSDSKDSSATQQKHGSGEQSNLCINGSHVYCEEPPPRTARIGSNFSLASSGHGSMEDVPENSPPSVDSLRTVRQYSPWTEEEEEEEAEVENKKKDMEEMRIKEEKEMVRRQTLERLAEEKRRKEEEERKQIEEKKLRREEERAKEEERVKREEDERERLAEEKRRLEEQERRRIEEEKICREEEEKAQEEKRRKEKEEEEERVRRQEEELERKRIEEEKARKEEEERIRMEEERAQEERKRRKEKEEEEERMRRQEEERERLAEEKRRQEEEERKRIEEEKARKEEEERIRMEEERAQEERRRRKEKEEEEERMRRQEEERERLVEEERKRIEEEKARKEEEERIRMKEERAQEERRRRKEKEEEEERMRTRQEEERERLAEEKRRQEEEERKRIEEEKVRKEEEERIRMEEERAQEERRRKEKEEEEERMRTRQEEERERLAEEKRRQEEEERKRIEEEKARKEEEERIRMEEERAQEERRRRKEKEEEEERMRRQEEERERLAEEKRRQEEEERKRIEEEKARKEEEERIRMEEEKHERLAVEKRRLEEQEKRRVEEEKIRREEEERIRMEEERAQEERRRKEKEEEEEIIRRQEELERLAEKRRQEEEERKRIEEEKTRREEEEQIRREEEKAQEEKVRRQEEEREKLAAEKRRQEEERKRIEEEKARKEEEEMIRRERAQEEKRRQEEEREKKRRQEEEERIRKEERVRKEKEEIERLAEEKRREEQEKRRIKEGEKTKREEEGLTGVSEEQDKRENQRKDGHRAIESQSPAEVTSTNPFEENISNNPFDESPDSPAEPNSNTIQQRYQFPEPSVGSSAISTDEKAVITTQQEKRQAPLPPGRNQTKRRSNKEPDASTQHLAQINKLSKEKNVKTASILPQRSLPLGRPSTDTKNNQSLTLKSATKGTTTTTTTAKHTKRPAPTRPGSVEEKPLSEPKTSNGCVSEAKQVPVVYGLNPFDDDEDENELTAQDDKTASGNTSSVVWPPAVSQTHNKDDISQTKKSSKIARAPLPPEKTATTSSTLNKQNTDGAHDKTHVTVPDKNATQTCDPEPEAIHSSRVKESPLQESQPVTVLRAGEEASEKKEGPHASSRRLQPVKPLNPLEQQSVSGEKDPKSTGIPCEVEENTKVSSTGVKGPFSQLTQEELISLVLKQEKQLLERDSKISELECYIDNLIVRVIEEKPSILMSLNAMKKTV